MVKKKKTKQKTEKIKTLNPMTPCDNNKSTVKVGALA